MYSIHLRSIVFRLHNMYNFSIRHIADILQIGKSTVHRWLNGQSAPNYSNNGRPKKEVDIQSMFGDSTFKSIRELISNKQQVNVSCTTLWRRLKEKGYTNKRVYHCVNNNNQNLHTLRQQFAERMQNIPFQDVISIDESSFYLKLNPHRAWSKRNHRIHVPLQRTCSKRFTLISAICSKGLLHQRIYDTSMTAKLLSTFIAELPSNHCKYVLLDNAAFHKTNQVLQSLKDKLLEPLFTSPYSPEWNPVEFYFSALKSKYRKKDDVTLQSMEKMLLQIGDSLPRNYFHDVFTMVFKNIEAIHHR